MRQTRHARGEYELNWNVITGEAARRELEKYATLYGSYFAAEEEYQRKNAKLVADMQSPGAMEPEPENRLVYRSDAGTGERELLTT